MATRNASTRRPDIQPPRPLVIVQTGNAPLVGSWSIDTRLTRGSSSSHSRTNSRSRYSSHVLRDHRDSNVGPTDVRLETEFGHIRAAFSIVGREAAEQGDDRANLDVRSQHGNVRVGVVRDSGRRFRLTVSSDSGYVNIILPPDFVGTITHGEGTSFSARAFRLVRLGAAVSTRPQNWLNQQTSGSSRRDGGTSEGENETVTVRGMRHISVERDGTLRASDAIEARAGRGVRIMVQGEPRWHSNPLVARVMGLFINH